MTFAEIKKNVHFCMELMNMYKNNNNESFKFEALGTLNFHFHTFPFIFKYSFTGERMDIHTLLYFSFIFQTFVFKNRNVNYESLNEYLKMNGNVWKWKFQVWSPGRINSNLYTPHLFLSVNNASLSINCRATLKFPGFFLISLIDFLEH